jgi:hypothetical protein
LLDRPRASLGEAAKRHGPTNGKDESAYGKWHAPGLDGIPIERDADQ